MAQGVLSGPQIAAAVKEACPEHVAVAYVGMDWETFLPDLSKVRDLVLAPVLGTNPQAVLEIEKRLHKLHGDGWGRLHFLDSLHAKLFLGANRAVYGSANLSARGLTGNVLVELSRGTDNPEELAELRRFFNGVLAKAKKQYKSAEAKKARLDELALQMQRNPDFAGAASRKPLKFEDFELLSADQFYISWYQHAKLTYTRVAKQLDPIIDDDRTLCLLPNDKVKVGKWVLCWECADDDPTGALSWMRFDEVIPGGVSKVDSEPTEYTTLAFQRIDRPKGRHLVPFEITAKVRKAFVRSFQNRKLARQLQPDKLTTSTKALPLLIEQMREHYEA